MTYNYEPVQLDQNFKSFEKEGWYKLIVDKAEAGRSKGDYAQIKITFLAEGGECDGNKVFYDLIIPLLEKAYTWDKNVKTNEMFQDFGKPQFWLRRVGWMFQVFGVYIGINEAHTELITYGKDHKELPIENNKVLSAVAAKFIGQRAVGYIIPDTYEKEIKDKETNEVKTVTRSKGTLKELRDFSYQPKEGWGDYYDAPKATPAYDPETGPTDEQLNDEDEEFLI